MRDRGNTFSPTGSINLREVAVEAQDFIGSAEGSSQIQQEYATGKGRMSSAWERSKIFQRATLGGREDLLQGAATKKPTPLT